VIRCDRFMPDRSSFERLAVQSAVSRPE